MKENYDWISEYSVEIVKTGISLAAIVAWRFRCMLISTFEQENHIKEEIYKDNGVDYGE